jgi:putative PEP-CTERM system histidine kinase
VDPTASPIQFSIVMASALLAAVIGVLATLRRGHWLTTLVFSSSFLCIAGFQAGTLGILNAESAEAGRQWAVYLARSSALASWVWLTLSVVLSQSEPWQRIRDAGAYLTLALVGCIIMSAAAGSTYVIRDVTNVGGGLLIQLGPMGKIYLMYLVVVMVAVLMNLERMLRNAPATAQSQLRPMFVAFLIGIMSELLVVSAALLYSGLKVSWLVASAAPMFGSGAVAALALARRSLTDLTVPVARPVVYYSSVSLTLAGAFLLTMAVLSKLLPVLTPEWKQVVSLGFYLLVGGGGLLLTLSPSANRAVKRFIDRNFYANRYDYRREWERVSSAIVPTGRLEDISRQIEALVCAVFDAERAAIYLRDETDGTLQRVHGPAGMPAVIGPSNPLVLELERSKQPLVFDEIANDLNLIPAAVENRPAIQALPAAVCAPLPVGEQLVGLLWLSKKRNDESYSYEDADFLNSMARHLAGTLWYARQAEQLAETRQLESLHRLSSYVLHDIKNQVSGLSLVVDNARRHLSNPEFQRDAMAVVERTVGNLKELMAHVASVSRPPEARPEMVRVREVLEEATAASGLSTESSNGLRLDLSCNAELPVRLDRRLMQRVLVNLLTNAREAMQEGGEIALGASLEGRAAQDQAVLVLTVKDNGRGMTEEYVRTSLFRPFSSTKPGGLGVGLSQCKAIVEAQGGNITVDSRLGEGTVFAVRLPVAVTMPPTSASAVAPGAERERPGIAPGLESSRNLAGEITR